MAAKLAVAATLFTLATACLAVHGQEPIRAADPETGTATFAGAPVTTASAGSQARIVRLSQVRGAVELDRNTGHGFETAFTNLPIVEGSRLRTAEGVAEVEFEDNSTLRLTPHSTVTFPRLRLMPGGLTASTIDVAGGTVYASLAETKDNQFSLSSGKSTVTPQRSSRLRLQVGTPDELAVLSGTTVVTTASGTTEVKKKKTLRFEPESTTVPMLISKVEPSPYDDWNKESTDYHGRVSNAAFGGSSGLYGLNDLNYYGSFANLPGCGSAWRPYFASAAWDPYANGTWAYYGGVGYSWVSPYPWGWTPFHYGSWTQCGNGVWGWQPGGQWNGLANVPQTPVGLPTRGLGRPKPPLPPPSVASRVSLLPVNTRPLQVSRPSADGVFVFRNDSAGMGVPRQTSTKLSSVDHTVARYGAANVPLNPQPSAATTSGRAGAVSPAALTGRSARIDTSAAQRGTMPAAASVSQSAGSYSGSSSGRSQSSSNVSAPVHSAPASAPTASSSAGSVGRAGR